MWTWIHKFGSPPHAYRILGNLAPWFGRPPPRPARPRTGASSPFPALATGSIWGKPMWGTWWVWDARLTSELILLFLYLGYMALRSSFDDPQRAARAGALV